MRSDRFVTLAGFVKVRVLPASRYEVLGCSQREYDGRYRPPAPSRFATIRVIILTATEKPVYDRPLASRLVTRAQPK